MNTTFSRFYATRAHVGRDTGPRVQVTTAELMNKRDIHAHTLDELRTQLQKDA